jgi:hypothetical protein
MDYLDNPPSSRIGGSLLDADSMQKGGQISTPIDIPGGTVITWRATITVAGQRQLG